VKTTGDGLLVEFARRGQRTRVLPYRHARARTHKFGSCPLRPESDRNTALPRNDAKCQQLTHAPQHEYSYSIHLCGGAKSVGGISRRSRPPLAPLSPSPYCQNKKPRRSRSFAARVGASAVIITSALGLLDGRSWRCCLP
jgi:hypothetical protein